jgi:putative transposase
MTAMGIHGLLPARRKRTTDSSHDFPRFPNLAEGLEAVRPDHVWVADITFIRLRRDFVYLAAVMDVYTRVIRGCRERQVLEPVTALSLLFYAAVLGRVACAVRTFPLVSFEHGTLVPSHLHS